MTSNRRRTLFALAAATLGAPLLFAGGARAESDGPIKIGVIDPLSGPAARIGKENLEGINFALGEYGGKIAGRTIQFVIADDQNSPNVGLTETRRLVEEEKVAAVIGNLNSAVALAIHPYTTRMKMPYVTGGIAASITSTRKSPYTFRSSFAAGQLEAAAASFLVRKGYKTGVLMGSDYAAGHDAIDAVERNLKLLGGSAATELFPRQGETDYAPFFSRVAGQKADFVYAYFFGGDTLRFVRQYKSFGLKFPLIMTPSSLSAAGVAQALGEAVKGVYSPELWIWTLDDPATKKFVADFQAKFGHAPQTLTYDGYIKAKVVLEAIKALDGKITSGAALAKAMKGVKFMAPGGEFRFDENNNPVVNAYLVQWDWVDGKAVPKVLDSMTGIDQGWKPKK
jgi:branched-chain amino acid transport system substrate-binding protein